MEKIITKKEFVDAYQKYPPSGTELYFLKYFSIHSIKSHVFTELLLGFMLIVPFVFALIGKLLNWSHAITYVPSFLYAVILFTVGTYMIIIWRKKKKRLEKIRKELRVTRRQFKQLIEAYFYNRYYSTDNYIKYNSK